MTNFANFGITFQEKLIRILLREKQFSDQIREVLDVNFFEQKYLQFVTREIFSYKDQYKKQPSISTLEVILNNANYSNDGLKEQVWEFFEKQIRNGEKIDDVEYVKEQSIQFCKKQVIKEAMIKSVDKLEKLSFDEITVLINDAMKKGVDRNMGTEYLSEFEERYSQEHKDTIPTGWPEMDAIMEDGGLGRGELGTIIAPTGIGKSIMLMHLAAQALKAKKNVLYYTLELSAKYVGKRFDCCLSGIPMKDLKILKDRVYEKIKDIPGKLLIKEYPTKSASITTLKNHYEKLLQQDRNFDLIIVDYCDLLKPSVYHKETRDDLQSMYEELRGFAQAYNLAVWTASQSNREGAKSDQVRGNNISEAFSKLFVCDFVMTLTRSDLDKQAKTAKIFVEKSRVGPDGIRFNAHFDPTLMEVKLIENESNYIAPKEISYDKDEKKRIADVLKNFKNSK